MPPDAALKWVVSAADRAPRLDKFLAASGRIGSRGRVTEAIAKGKVFLNGAEVAPSASGRALRSGDVLQFWEDRPGSGKRSALRHVGALDIVYEDDDLIVVNKPPGLLTVPLAQRRDAPSVLAYLKDHLRAKRRTPLVVHRIDRDTSGLVLFAKNRRAQERLKAQFEGREPERVYVAIVHGTPHPSEGVWRDILRWDADSLQQKRAHPRETQGKEAITLYRVIETLHGTAVLECRLVTGKRNQIRIQARLHGHTLVGERLYVDGAHPARPVHFARQALHARKLEFSQPSTGTLLTLEAPLPADMTRLISQLRRG